MLAALFHAEIIWKYLIGRTRWKRLSASTSCVSRSLVPTTRDWFGHSIGVNQSNRCRLPSRLAPGSWVGSLICRTSSRPCREKRRWAVVGAFDGLWPRRSLCPAGVRICPGLPALPWGEPGV